MLPVLGHTAFPPALSQSSGSAVTGKSHRPGRCPPAVLLPPPPRGPSQLLGTSQFPSIAQDPSDWEADSLPPAVPRAQEQHRPQPPARTRPRSPAEAQGTMGFNTFFVVTKFKTLYHRFTFLYLGKALQRCILLPWVIKQKLSDNEALGSPQLLSEREPGRRRPAPAAAGLSAPCRHAAIGTGLPLSLPVISPSRCESSCLPGPGITEDKWLLWVSLLGERLLAD